MTDNFVLDSASRFVSEILKASAQSNRQARNRAEAKLFSAMDFSDAASANGREAFVDEVKAICGDHTRNLYRVANAFYRARLFGYADRLLSPPPDFAFPERLNLHASVSFKLGKLDDAMAQWKRALEMDAECIPAIRGLHSVYLELNDEGNAAVFADRLSAARESAQPGVHDLCALIVMKPWARLERFGRKTDGGYLVMEQAGGYDCFLSGGVGKYVEFEEAMCAAFDVDCHAFDPTVDGLPSADKRIHFHKLGIGGVNSDATTNLSEYLDCHRDVFVKMDVEGFEYNWIESLTDTHLRGIKQIVLEWHLPFTKRRLACLARLAKTHELVHVHPNNRGSIRNIAGVDIPALFETTFVRKEPAISVVPNSAPLPHPLDVPNTNKPEVALTWWPFVTQGRRNRVMPKLPDALTNSNSDAKRVVSMFVPDSCGLGDFLLRRCRHLASLCAQRRIDFEINFANHPHIGLFLRGSNCDVVDERRIVKNDALNRHLTRLEKVADNDVLYVRFSGKSESQEPIELCSSESIVSHFSPTDCLIQAVKETMTEMSLLPDSFISVHIRCGDAYMANTRVPGHKRWNDELWMQLAKIAEEHRDRTVLIHCDSSEIKDMIMEKFGWRSCIKVAPQHLGIVNFESITPNDALATLTELYVMSMSSKIYSLTRSNFPSLARVLKCQRHFFLSA